jgi:ribosomal protein S18 acetylase RimI-like enzyme
MPIRQHKPTQESPNLGIVVKSEELPPIEVRPAQSDEDLAWLKELWRDTWGGETMVSRGHVHRLMNLVGIIAWRGQTRAGAATFDAGSDEWELTSLNAIVENQGVGSALLKTIEAAARFRLATRLWFITTNDNLRALRFYQRRGYRLVAVYPGAVDEARKLKPTIPEIGSDGIPLHDEIELEKRFD